MDSILTQRQLKSPVAQSNQIDIIDLTVDESIGKTNDLSANLTVETVPVEAILSSEGAIDIGEEDENEGEVEEEARRREGEGEEVEEEVEFVGEEEENEEVEEGGRRRRRKVQRAEEEVKFVGEVRALYSRAQIEHWHRILLEEVENAYKKLITAEGNACEYRSRLFTDERAIRVLETAARTMGADFYVEKSAPKSTSVYNYRQFEDKNQPSCVIMCLKIGELVRITRTALNRFIERCIEEVFTERDTRLRESIVVEDDYTRQNPSASSPRPNTHVTRPHTKFRANDTRRHFKRARPRHRSKRALRAVDAATDAVVRKAVVRISNEVLNHAKESHRVEKSRTVDDLSDEDIDSYDHFSALLHDLQTKPTLSTTSQPLTTSAPSSRTQRCTSNVNDRDVRGTKEFKSISDLRSKRIERDEGKRRSTYEWEVGRNPSDYDNDSQTIHVLGAPACNTQGLGPNRGLALLQRMGWERGTGLGPRRDGRTDPIQVSTRRRRAGVGG